MQFLVKGRHQKQEPLCNVGCKKRPNMRQYKSMIYGPKIELSFEIKDFKV